jgi:serine/threonine-protein kinase
MARVLGRYVLHGELAAGGMATVHLGRLRGEAGFTRTVAIKRLHPQFAKDPDFVAMFVDEARLAARVRHPNVVPTLDVIRDGGAGAGDAAGAGDPETFLVMEYVAGESLSRLLRALHARKLPVPPRVASGILAGVLHGLHAAHEAKSERGVPLGIVHRDVSPQNVLVGTDGLAHVLDFGVAKAAGRIHTTREGELKGKLAYMAPEQLETGTLTRQSDVYAAAVVLWETLTLRRLFEGDSQAALLMQVVGGKVVAPSRHAPGVSPELDAVVLRGLARDPANRWATAYDFAMALERQGIAPPSEIGAWVQSIAGEVLARRAEMVAEIEGGSMSLRAAAPREVPSAGDVLSQVSALALSSSEPAARIAAPRPWSSGGKGHFFVGALAGLLVMLAVFAFRRGAAHSSTASSPPPEASTSPAGIPLLVAPQSPTTATGTALEAPPSPSASEPEAPLPPLPVARPTAPVAASAARVTTAPPTPAKAAPKTRPECDPPFTRDSLGHKHYKLQCL